MRETESTDTYGSDIDWPPWTLECPECEAKWHTVFGFGAVARAMIHAYNYHIGSDTDRPESK